MLTDKERAMSEINKDYHQGFKDAIENIRKHYLQLEDYYAWDKGYYHKIFGDAVSIERQIFEYLRVPKVWIKL